MARGGFRRRRIRKVTTYICTTCYHTFPNSRSAKDHFAESHPAAKVAATGRRGRRRRRKGRVGRPPGSKNKRRGRVGRPPGSTNRKRRGRRSK